MREGGRERGEGGREGGREGGGGVREGGGERTLFVQVKPGPGLKVLDPGIALHGDSVSFLCGGVRV